MMIQILQLYLPGLTRLLLGLKAKTPQIRPANTIDTESKHTDKTVSVLLVNQYHLQQHKLQQILQQFYMPKHTSSRKVTPSAYNRLQYANNSLPTPCLWQVKQCMYNKYNTSTIMHNKECGQRRYTPCPGTKCHFVLFSTVTLAFLPYYVHST